MRRRAVGGSGTALGEAPEPWRRRDAAVVALVVALGVVGLVVTWVGISGTAKLTPQARWLGFGIASLMLTGFAMVGWLVLGLTRVAATPARWCASAGRGAVGRRGRGHRMVLVLVTDSVSRPRAARYHLAHCPLLAGKDVRWLDAATLAFARTPSPAASALTPVVEL